MARQIPVRNYGQVVPSTKPENPSPLCKVTGPVQRKRLSVFTDITNTKLNLDEHMPKKRKLTEPTPTFVSSFFNGVYSLFCN
jgi:hypothetical protein